MPATALGAALPLRDFVATSSDTTLAAEASEVTAKPSETWEDQTYTVVAFMLGGEGRAVAAVAYVGTDKLIHRLIETAQTRRGTVTKEWRIRNIVLNGPVDSSRFAYSAPTDATPLARGGRAAALEPGSEAPDFTVTSATGAPVKLSDFRGKTVVLDFWATWCWPCNQSLPHTEAVVESPANKDVVVLAVAIWDSKVGFDAWIKKHSFPRIQFVIDPSPQGEDVASRLYHIPSTPTAYVIDPDGIVVKSVSGYTGPSTELADAIASARGGKKVAGL